MSDLQCPATLLIVRTSAAEQQAQQVPDLVGQMDGRRVAAVYSSPTEPARESAGLTASGLGLQAILIDGLEDRFTESIGEIADVHRGETVLVFTPGEVTEINEIEVDSDGWRPVASRQYLEEQDSEPRDSEQQGSAQQDSEQQDLEQA